MKLLLPCLDIPQTFFSLFVYDSDLQYLSRFRLGWWQNREMKNHRFLLKWGNCQFSSVTQLCLTLCDTMNSSTPDFLSITNSRSPPKPMSVESVIPSSHLILCRPFSSCPQSFPASGSFPMSQPFTWGGQSIGVSASTSVLPMNTQDWSPLEWTAWIFMQSNGLSRVFSNATFQKHQFFGAQLSLQCNSHIHTWPLKKP